MNKTIITGSGKRVAGIALSAVIAASSVAILPGAAGVDSANAAAESVNTASASIYGLKDKTQDGVILHAWEWSFNNIKANMKKIAEAGYTSVQTSVIQQAKESTKGRSNKDWWMYYQPAQFRIDDTGNSALGTKAEFKAMCKEAHKYGIHVIVDVVANHLGNDGDWYTKSRAIPDDIRKDDNCWHDKWNEEINYDDRYSITHGSMGGLPDLNTENPKIQTYVKNYLRECIDCGADGFRFDAAKHIGVPHDNPASAGGDFWPNVISDATSYYQTKGTYKTAGLYCYGEVLGGTGGPSMSEYTNYIKVTDSEAGNKVRRNVNKHHNAAGAASSYYDAGAGAENTVLWAESHDTYAGDDKNEDNRSTQFSQYEINLAWAIVGSRNKATALYLARTKGYRIGNIGDVDNTACFDKEVVEVNKFHNYFAGQGEYLASSGSIAYNERGTSGVVLVNVNGGSASVNVAAHNIANGEYTDQVTGNKFTVSGGKISGQIGDKGIAVVYNAQPIDPGVLTSSVSSGQTFSDSLEVTISSKNMANASYITSEGAEGAVTDGMKLTLGKSLSFNTNVTLTLTGMTNKGNKITNSYVYKKVDPDARVKIYFDNSGYKWKKVYTYIYDDSSKPAAKNADWPGVEMTYNSSLGLYEYEVPENLVNGKALFTESKTATTNRYPADSMPGLPIGGTSMKFSSGNKWEEYSAPVNELKNTSVCDKDSIKYESSVTLNGSATGGTAPYTFAFYYKYNTSKYWHAIGTEFGNKISVDFKPGTIGKYDLKVIVKDKTGKTAEKTFDLYVSDNTIGSFDNNSRLSDSAVRPSTRVYLYGMTKGSQGTCTYSYYYKNTKSKIWHRIGDEFTSAGTASFKPKNEAEYDIRIEAKDITGEVVSKYLKLYVYNSCGTKLVNKTTATDDGKYIILNGAADGGYAQYLYTFSYRRVGGKTWKNIGELNSPESTAKLKASSGGYEFKVIVLDEKGNVAEKLINYTF